MQKKTSKHVLLWERSLCPGFLLLCWISLSNLGELQESLCVPSSDTGWQLLFSPLLDACTPFKQTSDTHEKGEQKNKTLYFPLTTHTSNHLTWCYLISLNSFNCILYSSLNSPSHTHTNNRHVYSMCIINCKDNPPPYHTLSHLPAASRRSRMAQCV